MSRPRTHGRRRLGAWALLLAAATQLGCGPTPEQIGGAVLVACPLAFGAAALLVWILQTQWQRVRPEVVMRGPPSYWAAAILVVLAIVGIAAGAPDPEVVMLACWLAGGSCVAQTLLWTRLWLAVRPDTACTWAGIFAIAPNALLALVLVAGGGGKDLTEILVPFWAVSGAYAAAPTVLWLALFIEAVVRAQRDERMFREREGPAIRSRDGRGSGSEN